MTRLFRSKSCGHVVTASDLRSTPPTTYLYNDLEEEKEEDEEEVEEEVEEEEGRGEEEGKFSSSKLRCPGSKANKKNSISNNNSSSNSNSNSGSPVILPILEILVGALRKSLVTCTSVGIERDDDDIVSTSTSTSTSTPTCIQHISWPCEVKHISHVTFDRFNGFLGLPSDFQLHLPPKVPSASVSVFGVSAKSMQCSYDDRGNSVPTILLMLQKQLYSEGGLKAEGIFRINAENSQEEYVREQLNKGVVPHGIDVHCLAGLIKAWFRELPTGILDSLTPEQVMHCNTEEECTQLVKLLAPTEAALLDWAINLMADVVLRETYNKMNARNIAMVFAPNMTQMADRLTALIDAVQVMNFLKSLILKTLREREESARNFSSSSADYFAKSNVHVMESNLGLSFSSSSERMTTENYTRTISLNMRQLEVEAEEVYDEDEKKRVESWGGSSIASRFDQVTESEDGDGVGDESGNGDWLSLRRGVRRLCRNPVFQLSKLANKKPQSFGIVHSKGGEDGGEAWA